MELKTYWVFVAGFVIVLFYVAMVVAQRRRTLPGMGAEGFANPSAEFIMFGVPWCPHCVAAKPEFEKLGSSGSIVTIGERAVSLRYVNPEEEPKAATGYDIQGYPTFFLVKDGQPLKYAGPRSMEGFQQFLQENVA